MALRSVFILAAMASLLAYLARIPVRCIAFVLLWWMLSLFLVAQIPDKNLEEEVGDEQGAREGSIVAAPNLKR